MAFDRKYENVTAIDERCMALPFSLAIGSSGAVGTLKGDGFLSAAHTTTGKYTLTLVASPQVPLAAVANIDPAAGGADTENLYCQCTISGNTIVIRTKTTTSNTDPTNGDVITGVAFVKLTDRVQEV